MLFQDFPGGSDGKESTAVWETGLRSLGWEDPLEKVSGDALQYSCLEDPMDARAWTATDHGVAELDMTE